MPNWCRNELTISGNCNVVESFKSFVVSEEDGVIDFNACLPRPHVLKDAYQIDAQTRTIDFPHLADPTRLGKVLLKNHKFEDVARYEKLIADPDINVDTSIEDNIKSLFDKIPDKIWAREHGNIVSYNFYKSISPSLKLLLDTIFTAHQASRLIDIGFSSWYDWSIENWGVKWNAEPVDVSFDSDGEMCDYKFTFDTPWSAPTNWFTALVREANNFDDLTLVLEYGEPGEGFGGRLEMLEGEVEFTKFDRRDLSEFVHGDPDFLDNEEAWFEATNAIGDEELLDDEYADHKFTDEELEDNDGQ